MDTTEPGNGTAPGPDQLERIRKLLAKAEAPGVSPAEAEALTAKAHTLMAQYGVDQAMLWAARQRVKREEPADRRFDIEYPFARARCTLLHQIANGLRCRTVQWSRAGDRRHRKFFYIDVHGFPSDIERADVMYTSLVLQSAAAMKADPVPAGEDSAAFHDSWLTYFAYRVRQRIDEAEQAAAAAADTAGGRGAGGRGAELVLADRKSIVDARFGRLYPDLKKGTARKLSGSGGQAGWEAGGRADLGLTGQVSGAARNAIAQ